MTVCSWADSGETLRSKMTKIATPPPRTEEVNPDGRSKKRLKAEDDADVTVPTTSNEEGEETMRQPKLAQLKSLHPFFMSRTTSTDSVSVPSIPLPQGKTVYLGNADPETFPPNGMNHIFPASPSPSPVTPYLIPHKHHKGKGKPPNVDLTSITSLIPPPVPLPDFIPPEKLTEPKSYLSKLAQRICSSHPAHKNILSLLDQELPSELPWTQKFRPQTADQVLSQGSPAVDLANWISGERLRFSGHLPSEMDDFIVDSDAESSEAGSVIRSRFVGYENVCVLVGGHGTGKSASVYAVAETHGYEVFEVYPGMKRGAKELVEMVGEVGQSGLVTEDGRKRRKRGLVVFDEIDVLYEEDKAFWSGVAGLVEKSRQPIILTCNGTSFPALSNSDVCVLPTRFARCKTIEFLPASEDLVRDYLRLITLCQGHLIDPTVLEATYLSLKRDLRQTLTTLQFWCQFGLGDARCGTDWLNWDGGPDSRVLSRDTLLQDTPWRQFRLLGRPAVLEEVESELDLEELFCPSYFEDVLDSSTSMFRRNRKTVTALEGLEEYFATMSVMDFTVDGQFTAFEIPFREKVSQDDLFSDVLLREHLGRRFERPQGVERKLSPEMRILAHDVLKEKLLLGGFNIPPLSTDRILHSPLEHLLFPINSLPACALTAPLAQLLYLPTLEDKFLATVGTQHPPHVLATDVLPLVRQIMRVERQRQRSQRRTEGELWGNVRKTRRRKRDVAEGANRYWGEKVDTEEVLRTWIAEESDGRNDCESE
jgi:hypothetical protein